MQDEVREFRIEPRHIYTKRGFNEFGRMERDDLAAALIQFCQSRGDFSDFLREDLEKLGLEFSYINLAEELDFIRYVGKGVYQFDIEFLRRAYHAGQRAKVWVIREEGWEKV